MVRQDEGTRGGTLPCASRRIPGASTLGEGVGATLGGWLESRRGFSGRPCRGKPQFRRFNLHYFKGLVVGTTALSGNEGGCFPNTGVTYLRSDGAVGCGGEGG